MTIYVQRESIDWVKKAHYQDDAQGQPQPYTGSWSYQIVAYKARPTGAWVSAVVNGSNKGINIGPMAAGYYHIFYRMDGQAPYTPELDPEVLVVQ